MHRSRCGNGSGHYPGIEIMLNDFNCACPVYIACGYTDLRRGIDGLAGIVQAQFQMDPVRCALYLFFGRQRDRIKALYWGGRLCAAVQAAGEWQLSVAAKWRRGACDDAAAVPLADGGAEYRTAESA